MKFLQWSLRLGVCENICSLKEVYTVFKFETYLEIVEHIPKRAVEGGMIRAMVRYQLLGSGLIQGR